MITKFATCLLFLALLLNSCQQRNQPTSPQYEAEYNRSTTPALIDIAVGCVSTTADSSVLIVPLWN